MQRKSSVPFLEEMVAIKHLYGEDWNEAVAARMEIERGRREFLQMKAAKTKPSGE